MKLISTILFVLLLTINSFSQSGWIQQYSGVTSNLNSVKFIDNETGLCAGQNGTILRTSNSGQSWITIATDYNSTLNSLIFTKSGIVFAVGDGGIIIKSTNRGLNWTDIPFQHEDLMCIYFPDDSVGYTGGGGNMFKTTNGGLNWFSISIWGSSINTIHFVNNMTGWFAGFSFSYDVMKTTDGGATWVDQAFSNTDSYISSIFFLDSLNGWLSSPYSTFISLRTIFKTTNGGDPWYDPLHFQWTGTISYSLYFTDLNNGWAAGEQGLIFHTSDGGLNWTTQTSKLASITYRSIFFTDSITGWSVGDGGRILKTTTGGLTYTGNSNLEVPVEYSLSQNYPNPFNPKTIISYSITSNVRRRVPSGSTSDVKLIVYDALGRSVSILVNESKLPGNYEVEFDGSNFPSGIYFYRLEVDGEMIDAKRMLLLK